MCLHVLATRRYCESEVLVVDYCKRVQRDSETANYALRTPHYVM
jgi:hypothetical protein